MILFKVFLGLLYCHHCMLKFINFRKILLINFGYLVKQIDFILRLIRTMIIYFSLFFIKCHLLYGHKI
jgi:hypothetical protein